MCIAVARAVAMEVELEVETQLSQRPAVEANDSTALTKEQQEELDKHKVRFPTVLVHAN